MRKLFLLAFIVALFVGLSACGGGSSSSSTGSAESADPAEEVQEASLGDPAKGKIQYDQLCITCHGPDGGGIEGLGKPFTTSAFLAERTDQEMLEFVKTGRPMSDPLNTTGVDMPPKGGNPALTDEQILDIIAFVRTLHE